MTAPRSRRHPSLAAFADSGESSLPSVTIADEAAFRTVAFARFLELAADLTEVRVAYIDSIVSYEETMASLAEIGATVWLHVVEWGDHSTVLKLPTMAGEATVFLRADETYGDWKIQVAAATAGAADAAFAALGVLVPERPRGGTDDTVDVTFWMHHPMQGGVSRTRSLERLEWADVGRNYPLAVRAQLEALNALTSAPAKGNLMVFHGPPGTGKTRYLQQLAGAWSGWADVHYVVDPDEMFAIALYLHTVALGDYSDPDRWRLIVIEDGDEFIAADGKQRSGAGVARLLNVADGLIGQGLKIMVLVSTNVDKIDFNAAIVRSGRCGALVNFPLFPADEAAGWLAERGHEAELGEDALPLSDLYAFGAD